jgi:lipoate-protein ligase A
MNLRVITDRAGTGAANMAADASMAAALGRAEIPPTLRLYGWDPPALSIGYHQSERDFDVEKLARSGIDLVRRPTGGRAILHWHELTYAIVLPLSAGSPRDLYMAVHDTLLDGIRGMGIPALPGGSDEGLRASYSSPDGVACFSRSVRSEIQVGGKKIVGSAQRKIGDVILQHGSFLLGPQHRRLAEFLQGGAHGPVPVDFVSKTTEAETILGRPVSFSEAATAVASAFVTRFSTPHPLTAGAAAELTGG